MIGNPAVSVIIPAFNSERTIWRALSSVRSQTFDDFEVIVVDDASTDNTARTIELASENDSRIRFLRSTVNQGPGAARNRALEVAKGRYIAFLDSDDEWIPEKLERQLHFMSKNPDIALCYAAYRRIEAGGKSRVVMPPLIVDHTMLTFHNYIGCLTAMYDTTRTAGKIYMPTNRSREDWALWLRITKKFGAAAGMPNLLGTLHRESLSSTSNKWKSTRDTAAMFQTELGFTSWRAFVRSMAHNVISAVILYRCQVGGRKT